MKYVGKNIPRNDGFDKATGLGQFTMDVSMPHMLYARVLRTDALFPNEDAGLPLPLKLCQA